MLHLPPIVRPDAGAANPPSLAGDTALAPLNVALMGGAGLGLSLAMGLARAGHGVLCFEEDAGSLERAAFYFSRLDCPEGLRERVRFSGDRADLGTCAVLLDLAMGSLAEKTALWAPLWPHVPQGATLALPLAGPDLAQIAAQAKGAVHAVLGLLVATPVIVGGVAEIAVPQGHPADAPAGLMALLQGAGLSPLLAGRSAAFASETLLLTYLAGLDRMLMQGATPWEIDEVAEWFGCAMGPFEAQDLIGTDLAYHMRQRLAGQVPGGPVAAPIADRAVEEGRLGKKAGVGWYRYPGGGGKVIDPLVEDLCREEAHFARVPPHDWPQEAIIETLFLPQLLALARVRALGGGWDGPALALLAERVLGFPPGVGGPLGYARAVGWPQVMAALGARSQDAPEFWAAYRALAST